MLQVMKNRMRGALKSLIRLRGPDYDCARERDALGKIKSHYKVFLSIVEFTQKSPTHTPVKTKLVVQN